MSVVASQTRGRWALVALGLAVLCALPSLTTTVRASVAGARGPAQGEDAEQLVRRALGSASVAHSATAQTRGTLGLPDLPSLGGVAALLGGTTRTRVWWSSPQAWRVDTLTTTGERGDYGVGGSVVSWDYERTVLEYAYGADGIRLPRADDLLPPQAARRVLAALGPGDRLRVLGRRLVAGRAATGVRAVPGDDRSTIARVDVWLDTGTGLPLEVRVRGADGLDALASTYLDVRIGQPAAATLQPPSAPGARHRDAPSDVVSTAELESPWLLPPRLAGLPVSGAPAGGTAVYGDGLARFAVVPVGPGRASTVLTAARGSGAPEVDVVGGQAVLVGTPLLNLVVARGYDFQHAYVVVGLVDPATLEDAVRALLADPPPRREGSGGRP